MGEYCLFKTEVLSHIFKNIVQDEKEKLKKIKEKSKNV